MTARQGLFPFSDKTGQTGRLKLCREKSMVEGFALGTVTPSGNRTVERVVQSMLGDMPGAAALFTGYLSSVIPVALLVMTWRE